MMEEIDPVMLFVMSLPFLLLAASLFLYTVRARRKDSGCYPNRPMDNREKRAYWAMKHFMQEDALPNTFFKSGDARKRKTGW